MIQSQIGVGQRLGLHALGGVHHQHRALAGGQGAGHLVVEVHMARSVNEVQGVNLAVLGLVKQMDGPGLDGDAPLALQVHVVQQLVFHLPLRHGVAFLQQAVRQRGFAVVNVSDDGEITDVGLVEHKVKASLGKIHAEAHTVRPSVLRSKTLPQAEFISAEGYQYEKTLSFRGAKRRGNPFPP